MLSKVTAMQSGTEFSTAVVEAMTGKFCKLKNLVQIGSSHCEALTCLYCQLLFNDITNLEFLYKICRSCHCMKAIWKHWKMEVRYMPVLEALWADDLVEYSGLNSCATLFVQCRVMGLVQHLGYLLYDHVWPAPHSNILFCLNYCHYFLFAAGIVRFNFAIIIAGFKSRSSPHDHLYEKKIKIPSLHVYGATDTVIGEGLKL